MFNMEKKYYVSHDGKSSSILAAEEGNGPVPSKDICRPTSDPVWRQ